MPALASLLLLLVLVPTWSWAFSAFTIEVLPHDKHCFHENLKKADRLDLTFQVTDGGNLDVDFWVCVLSRQTRRKTKRKTLLGKTALSLSTP
jgi:p24 family protein beta-1